MAAEDRNVQYGRSVSDSVPLICLISFLYTCILYLSLILTNINSLCFRLVEMQLLLGCSVSRISSYNFFPSAGEDQATHMSAVVHWVWILALFQFTLDFPFGRRKS